MLRKRGRQDSEMVNLVGTSATLVSMFAVGIGAAVVIEHGIFPLCVVLFSIFCGVSIVKAALPGD